MLPVHIRQGRRLARARSIVTLLGLSCLISDARGRKGWYARRPSVGCPWPRRADSSRTNYPMQSRRKTARGNDRRMPSLANQQAARSAARPVREPVVNEDGVSTSLTKVAMALDALRPSPLRRSVVSSGTQFIVSMVVMALVFPVMLSRLGGSMFGWWAALTAPTSLADLFGFGLSPAVLSLLGRSLGSARSAVSYREVEANLSRAGRYAAAGVMLSLLAGAATLALGWWLAPLAVSLLHLPENQVGPGTTLFRASMLSLALMIVGSSLTAQIDAVGRVDLSSLSNGLLRVLNGVLVLVAVLASPGFQSLAGVVAVVGVLSILIPGVLLRVAGVTALMPWYGLTRASLKEVLRLSLSLGSASAIGSLIDPALKWSVGWGFGPLPVAAYELASRVVTAVAGLFRALLYPLLPLLASHHGSGQLQEATAAVTAAVGRCCRIAYPTLAALAVGSSPLLALWLNGTAPKGSASSVVVLCAGSAIGLAAVPAYYALSSGGFGRRILSVSITYAVVSAAVIGALLALSLAPGTSAALAYAGGAAAAAVTTVVAYGRTISRPAALSLLHSTARGLAPAAFVAIVGLVCVLAIPVAQLQLVALGLLWAVAIAGSKTDRLTRIGGPRKPTRIAGARD